MYKFDQILTDWLKICILNEDFIDTGLTLDITKVYYREYMNEIFIRIQTTPYFKYWFERKFVDIFINSEEFEAFLNERLDENINLTSYHVNIKDIEGDTRYVDGDVLTNIFAWTY